MKKYAIFLSTGASVVIDAEKYEIFGDGTMEFQGNDGTVYGSFQGSAIFGWCIFRPMGPEGQQQGKESNPNLQ